VWTYDVASITSTLALHTLAMARAGKATKVNIEAADMFGNIVRGWKATDARGSAGNLRFGHSD